MDKDTIEKILGRRQRPVDVDWDKYDGTRVFITGGRGSIGSALAYMLTDAGARVTVTDIDEYDVRTFKKIAQYDLVMHLAAMKYAPEGEEAPADTVETNVVGTYNVLAAAGEIGARVVAASTCKAVEPETVYGASKLIAERMVLNAGGTVARLYNVVPAAGNVFETWAGMKDPVPVTACFRFFISLKEAVHLVAACGVVDPGRYTVDPGNARKMADVADALGRKWSVMPIRRGDRVVEPELGRNEYFEDAGHGLRRVVGAHDAAKVRA